MKTDMEKWRKAIIESKETQALPLMANFGAILKGISLKNALTDGKNQAGCIEAVTDAFGPCACTTFMDLSVEAEAFGCGISMSDNETPTVSSGVVTDMDSAVRLRIPDPASNRTAVYLEAAGICSSRSDRPLFACIIGPFSLAGRLMDMTRILVSLYGQAATVHTVLEKCASFLTGYALAFKKAGANGVIMAEPAASLMSPKQCAEFSSAYIKRITDAVQDDGFSIILHNCGKTTRHVETMLSTSAKGLHFGNAVDLRDIAPKIPADTLFMGNIDPVSAFRMGSPDDMARETASLLDAMRGYPNFVISSGCDIPAGVKKENFEAFFGAVKEYNTRRIVS